MSSRLPALAVFAVVALWAGFASAQAEPTGLEAGPVRFHPGAFLEATYDSNLFYEDADDIRAGDTTAVYALRPGLSVRAMTPNPILADWRGAFRVSWEQYLSSNGRVSEQNGAEATFDTSLHVWPDGTFSITPRFMYARTNGPADQLQQRDYDQHTIYPGFHVEIAPQGGVIFSQRLGYDLRVRLYDEFEDINNLDHRFVSSTRWNFLPQTALSLLVEQHVTGYLTEVRSLGSGAPYDLVNSGSTPFRAQLGLTGLLMNRLNVTLLGGYGYTFYDQGPNEHLFIGRGELGYQWKAATKLSAGYVRNFEDSTFGNYFTFHRIFALFQTRIRERVDAGIEGRVSWMSFSEVANTARQDVVYDLDLSAAYIFIPGLTLRFTYQLRGNSTNFAVIFADGRQARAAYIKHQAHLALGYEY